MKTELWAMEDSLKAIRAEYFATLDARYEGIAKDWGIVAEGDENEPVMEDLIRRVHNLAGSGALYGLKQISKTAKLLENFLSAYSPGQDQAPGDAKAHGDSLLEELRTAMTAPGKPGGDPLN